MNEEEIKKWLQGKFKEKHPISHEEDYFQWLEMISAETWIDLIVEISNK